MSEYFRIRNTVKYPTSLVVNAGSNLGLEIANALLEQGGYVILVDVLSEQNLQTIFNRLGQHSLFTLIDYAAVPHLEEDLRRLDYVFYLQHEYQDVKASLSSQQFLRLSNYIDSTMKLAAKFQAKYLLATSMATHQLAYLSQDMQVENATTRKVATYNPVELQRYAENICLEYVTDLSLNARVVRLAEVIGKGVDFLKQSMFNKIVLSTAAAQEIVLPGDGLDSEYYVSVMDSAYAIVKAQFSKDTSGNIYSVAYEHPVTALSIAYRLQDLEPTAGQIIFDQDQPSQANIRLYRPANSLSDIGWKPNVNLDDALKDSLTSAKQFLLQAQDEELTATLGDGSPILRRIRELVSAAKTNHQEDETGDSGPVSRLIAQRRSQQAQQENSLIQADNYIKVKQKDRSVTSSEKFNNWAWNVRNYLADKFSFLKNLTPTEFVGAIMLLVIAVIVYLGVISPGLVFLRNHLALNEDLVALDSAVQTKNISLVVDKLNRIQPALKENMEILAQTRWALDLVGLSSAYQDLSNKLTAQNSQLSSAARLGNSLKSIDIYLKNYQANLRSRISNDNYLNLTATVGYAAELSSLTQEIAVVEASKERIQSARSQLLTNITGWPNFVSNYYAKTAQGINAGVDLIYSYSDLAGYAPEMLGIGQAKNYLIAVVDSSRPMPIGGEIATTAVLTMQDGAIVNAQVQNFENISVETLTLAPYLQDEVNLMRFNPANNFLLKDLAYIRRFEDFASAAKTEWGRRTNLNIDVVLVLDLQALGDWAQVLGGVVVEQQLLSNNDLPRALDLLQAGNNTSQRRNDLISQFTANVIEQSTASWKTNFYKILASWAASFSTNDLHIQATNLKLQKLLDNLKQINPPAENADVYTQVYLINDRRTNVNLSLPRVDMLQILGITDALSFQTQNYYVKIPTATGLDHVGICVGKSIAQFQVQNVPNDRIRTNRGRSVDCYILDLVSETEVIAAWTSTPIDLQASTEYNFTVGIGKNTGLDITADLEINYPNRFNLTSVKPLLDQEVGRLLSKLVLRADQTIELEFKTQ